jgi:hypothetical protein
VTQQVADHCNNKKENKSLLTSGLMVRGLS